MHSSYMIDDIAGIADCRESSVTLNAIINAKIESKKLPFNWKKYRKAENTAADMQLFIICNRNL